MKSIVDAAIPLITFTLLAAVGLGLTPAEFGRLRRTPTVVAAGLFVPLLALPVLAIGLIALFDPAPAIEAGLLLVAGCPIGGISNTYSYLARASTALSVTLTGMSCLLSAATLPLVARLFESVLR